MICMSSKSIRKLFGLKTRVWLFEAPCLLGVFMLSEGAFTLKYCTCKNSHSQAAIQKADTDVREVKSDNHCCQLKTLPALYCSVFHSYFLC